MSETEIPPSSAKKHKKHRSEKRERDSSNDRPPGLKLILKVGGQNTPEHNAEWPFPSGVLTDGQEALRSHHKKSKKKKKKKDRNKDREKKHKHHHKEKRRRKEEPGGDVDDERQDDLHSEVT